ncbi:MAG: hypothetical protein K0R65_1289 [Crocinitomicaceae bacterium]|jgi:predicted outer membrane repeat protein|nr:hypothetical protein [Crocinitomicaceae bacterium]
MIMKKYLPLIAFILTCFSFNAATITVTNTNDSGPGSFRQAVADANMGDIIRFSPSLLAGGSDTIVFATPVNITKGLFIKGVYNSTDTLYFSGGSVSRMIDINMVSSSTFGNVDMDSLVFINGYSTEGGALNYNSNYNPNARLYLRHCVFRNNSAPSGGAIYSYKTSPGTGSNYTCNITLEYSTFKSNSSSLASGGGGALYIYRYSSTIGYAVAIDLVITGCNFLNNTTPNKGGAIYTYVYAYGPPSTGVCNVDVTSSSFIGNEATHYGGALYVYSFGNTRCEAHSTISTWSGNTTIGSGGACYLESVAHQTLFDASFSTFYGNTAFVDGSALYLKSDPDYTATIETYGSIYAANSGNVNYQNTIYQSGSSVPFSSNCYNLFDFPQNHLSYYQEYIPDASDDFNQTLAQINLASVALNPNGTYTMVPMTGSVAINAGPGPWGIAQNRPALGIRDIGAAESDICTPVPVSQNASFCQGSFYDFYGQVITNAGTYTHTIVTPGQCDSLVTLTLTQTTPVAPTISISANPGNTIMTGTQVTITANYANGGTTPSFQWYANGSPIGPNAPSVISSTLFDGVQVSCEMTSNAGCVNPAVVTSNTITFTVHANNDEACNAIPLDVNQSCVTEYFANHIATNSTNVGAHTCASPTSRDIWFTFTAPASGNVEIYTYAGTLLDAVMSVYLGPTCSSLFTAGCADDDGLNQMPSGMVTGATPGSTYYIRVSSFGTTASGNFGICVVDGGFPPVTPVITSNDNDNNLCEGGSLILTSDATSGNVWSTGETTQSITVSTAGTYTVTANSLTSAPITVTTTTINSTVSQAGTVLTAGEVVAAGTNFQWIDCNDGNASIPGATSRNFTATVDGSYAVIITKNGCAETSSCITIDIASIPVITSNDTDNNLCEGGSLMLTSDATSGNVWSNGQTTQAITVNTAGTYSVTVNGLGSNEITVTTTTIDATAVDSGLGILTAGEATAAGVTYQWIDCNNGNTPVAGATGRDFTPTANGSYAVIITKNGCSETSDCVIFSNVSLTELSGLNVLSIHPNPNEGTFTIDFKSGTQRTIKVYNTLGALVHEQSSDSVSTEIRLEHVETGLYLVEVTEGSSVQVKKITVNK